MHRPTLIIKTGTKIPSLAELHGDYEDWIARGLGIAEPLVVDVSGGTALPPPQSVGQVLITGSGAMVTDGSDWIEATVAWLRQAVAAATPILGICFGHQLLAHALGGTVDYHPEGVEVGTVTITLTPAGRADPLLGSLPERFPAQVSHSQSVLRVPSGARVLARSAHDAHQAIAFTDTVWGLQFHPEFDAAIVRHYVNYYRATLGTLGRDTDQLLADITDSPASASLLARFSALNSDTR